ncbi:heavy metal translocating P-type ATPase [Xanthobacter sp. TB0139]|uniref:heavy metal translocating P-type ATPase n=1 Tax=Xanthobacter sp. TB0139 TaxID=3459178 RepID=UPI004039507F
MNRPVETREWTVTGMDCGSCAEKIRTAVERLPGVSDVEVAMMSERLRATLASDAASPDTIEKAVRKLGYDIVPRKAASVPAPASSSSSSTSCCGGACAGSAPAHNHSDHDHPDHAHAHTHAHSHDDPAERGQNWYRTRKGTLVLLTGTLLVAAWAVEAILPGFGLWPFVAACLIGLYPVARNALALLRTGQPFSIESLMTIAAIGALFIGAAEEAALVVFLFAVGEVLEGVAANKARDGIRALSRLVPKTARLETAQGVEEVPAETLAINQVVRIAPGDRIPADGVVLDGISGVDESPVTGESVPALKQAGDTVFAGSINSEAQLRVRVTKAAADNTIARIIRLVEEAESARAPTERFIDRFSRWYMPAVVGIALLTVLIPPLLFGQAWDVWIYRGLALLLIGCPCALVISVPASIASALSTGARHGLLLKGGAVVEAAAHVRHVAFDKTGTLTRGRPDVTDVVPLEANEAELLAIAAGIEDGSRHPLAEAILRRAQMDNITPTPMHGARALPGQGAEALLDDVPHWVASPAFAEESGVLDKEALACAEALEGQGKTTVVVFRPGRALGLLALRDEPRDDSAEAVRQLSKMGVSATMLTGDNPRTAAAIAGTLGMDYRAGMMPEDKLVAIRELGSPSGKAGVMMVGDGINDAPALRQATVGVAMGSGTDVALETADAAILRNRVLDVPAKIRLARKAMRNIHQNVALALGLKGVFLVTSILGITGLWIAILADTGATVLVTLNALRLLGYNPGREN